MATKGKENPEAKELLIRWQDQHYEKINAIPDPDKQVAAALSFDLLLMEMYFEAGYWEYALSMLEGENSLLEAAHLSNNDQLYDLITDLIEKIKSRAASHAEVVPPEGIPPNNIEDFSTEELQKKLQQAISPDTEDYDLAARIQAELKKRSLED
ncbi:MAG TPA: hypothetical protein VL576_02335 [Candidatus Paceibacterota bacterium]|nr:hypothetical protein [Candidatus Paceibacterota bacterium]